MATHFDRIPASPVISRFVAPWDTSGWYSVFPGFGPGRRLYSNSDVRVASLDETYAGWEYVRTFDSKADGFDDKQEVDFSLEQDAAVFVALDTAADPSFLEGFTDTGDQMTATDGCVYRILSRDYPGGAQVHIPGFRGDSHHFVVFVRPTAPDTDGGPFAAVAVPGGLPAYQPGTYRWYLHEVFNRMPDGAAPAGFDCTGPCRVERYPHQPQRKYVRLGENASLRKTVETGGREILELSVQVLCGTAEVRFCGTGLLLGGGRAVRPTGETAAESADGSFSLRFVRHSDTGSCTVWVNSRVAAQAQCRAGGPAELSLTTGRGALALLDRISLRDDTEVFVEELDFRTLPEHLALSAGAQAQITPYPFDTDPSLALSGGAFACAFAPTARAITVETRVKAEQNAFALLPELRDENGLPALRVAMYKNNLYATDGQTWVRLFEGDTDWMYYPCGNWFNIRVAVDLEKGCYDLFVDGARRARGFRLANPVGTIAQAGYSIARGRLYVNELRVYDALTICRGLMPPGQVFDVTAAPYHACGDGVTPQTAVLQRAIDDAACTGGTVLLRDGVFLTGGLQLRDDVTLFLDPSAVLKGTQDHEDYPLYTPGDSLCAARQLGRGILYGQNLCNVRVTGGGVMDGQGLYRFKMNDPKDSRLPDCRPSMIYLTYSSGIALEDVRFRSSAYWTVVPLSCRDLLLQYLDLDCMNTPNRDGIDPVDCRDMTIRRCNIMAGDDGLCFKSSDTFGCENIDVSDLLIQSLASGIKFGTDTYYSLKNARIRRCAVKNVNRCGISLETVDGAEISDVLFEEIDMTDVGAPVYVTVGERGRCPRNGHPPRTSSIDGVTFRRLRFDHPYPFSFTRKIREVLVVGQSAGQPVRNVTFEDCDFALPGGFDRLPPPPVPIDRKYPEYDQHGLADGHAFAIRFAENITLSGCRVTLDAPDARPFAAYHDYKGETV